MAVAVALGLFMRADTASATTASANFNYAGNNTQSKTLFDVGFSFGIPLSSAQVQVSISASADTKASITAPTDYTLNASDNPTEGANVTLSSTNVAQSTGNFNLSATPHLTGVLDYDANGDGFDCPTTPPVPSSVNDDTCLSVDLVQAFGVGTLQLINQSMTAPYAGGSLPFANSSTLFSVPVCKIVTELLIGVGIDVCNLNLDSQANATLEATADGTITDPGFHALQDFLINGTSPSGSSTINWPSPDPVVENIPVPCGSMEGASVAYQLTQNSYDSRVTSATAGFKLVVSFTDGLAFLPDLTILDLGTLFNLINSPIDVMSPGQDFQTALGTVQPETTPPQLTVNSPNPTSANEGQSTTFSATATDNCTPADQISFKWQFSDGTTAFGPSVNHTFPDDGSFSYQVTACDLRNNCTTSPGASYTVNEIPPVVDAGPAKQAVWGVPVSFHANGFDQAPNDNEALQYSWNFNDPNSPVGALGQDVSHVFSQPGTYNVVVTAIDEGGFTSTSTVPVTVTKRATSIAYTGALSGLPMHRTTLSAQVTDQFGQGAPGVTVTFVLGSGASAQTVTAVTNGSGVATASLVVNQKPPGNFPLTVSAAANTLYFAPGNSPLVVTFVVGK